MLRLCSLDAARSFVVMLPPFGGVNRSTLAVMSTPVHSGQTDGVPIVDTDDLVDAQGVADMLGLSYRNAVSEYQRRYPEMPRPVVDLGKGRPRLWSRTAMEAWARDTGRLR